MPAGPSGDAGLLLLAKAGGLTGAEARAAKAALRAGPGGARRAARKGAAAMQVYITAAAQRAAVDVAAGGTVGDLVALANGEGLRGDVLMLAGRALRDPAQTLADAGVTAESTLVLRAEALCAAQVHAVRTGAGVTFSHPPSGSELRKEFVLDESPDYYRVGCDGVLRNRYGNLVWIDVDCVPEYEADRGAAEPAVQDEPGDPPAVFARWTVHRQYQLYETSDGDMCGGHANCMTHRQELRLLDGQLAWVGPEQTWDSTRCRSGHPPM